MDQDQRMFPGVFDTLRRQGREISMRRGDTLFHQGDVDRSLYVLDSGRLEVSTLSGDGRKLALNVMRSGTIFGEIALFDGGSRSATVTALEDVRVFRIDRRRLLDAIRDDPDFAVEMIELCIRRLRWVNALLEDQAFQPLQVRLAHRVAFLLDAVGDGQTLPMSQSDLADHVGATREAVAKILADWKRAGIVEIARGRITVRNPAALREHAASNML